jgi:hypothetical protein
MGANRCELHRAALRKIAAKRWAAGNTLFVTDVARNANVRGHFERIGHWLIWMCGLLAPYQ